MHGFAAMVLVLLPFLVSCDGVSVQPCLEQGNSHPRDIGYSVLRKLLSDEQNIKAFRIVKNVITFQTTTDSTNNLIDDIASISSRSLTDIEKLATMEPIIILDKPGPPQFAGEILNALRVATASDLIMASRDDFEVNLILSQTQALRLISQLLKELRELDPNVKRQAWLEDLAVEYEDLYSRAVARLSVAVE
jgi:hypothetical protein